MKKYVKTFNKKIENITDIIFSEYQTDGFIYDFPDSFDFSIVSEYLIEPENPNGNLIHKPIIITKTKAEQIHEGWEDMFGIPYTTDEEYRIINKGISNPQDEQYVKYREFVDSIYE